MNQIRIVTDSASEITAPYAANLTVMPLTIHFGAQEYRDGVDISHRQFFEKLVTTTELPTTSLIPPAAFEAVFDRAEQDGETVIVIALSSKLSGTYQSAVIASDGRENVYVLDSLQATIGQQILVKYALHLVDEGKRAPEIMAELERVKGHIRLFGLTATLEYLRRGGRISNTVAILGGALSIKPVLELRDGVVGMLGKARGSKNGSNFLIKETQKHGIDFSMPLCVGYTGLSDDLLQQYIQDSRAIWEGHIDKLPICTVGATIGTHVGPGAIVVAFFDSSTNA